MAINYSTLLRLPKPDAGTQTWATYFHRLADIMDKFAGDVATVTEKTGSKTLSDADMTADNAKALVITCAQILTGNLTIVVPSRKRFYIVYNNTTGAFTLTVKAATGNGVTVKQGRFQLVWWDGTNMQAISRLSGLTTATEIATSIFTATMSGPYAAGSIINSLLATGAVKKTNLFGATGGPGVIRYTTTGAGNPWADLIRGTARQALLMSTAAQPKPSWGTLPFTRIATSTGIALAAGGSAVSYTHGLTGIAAKRDIKSIWVWLECLSTEGGYSAGDILHTQDASTSAADQRGFHPYVDSLTAVSVMVGSGGVMAINKSSGTKFTLTPSKWAVYVSVLAA